MRLSEILGVTPQEMGDALEDETVWLGMLVFSGVFPFSCVAIIQGPLVLIRNLEDAPQEMGDAREEETVWLGMLAFSRVSLFSRVVIIQGPLILIRDMGRYTARDGRCARG